MREPVARPRQNVRVLLTVAELDRLDP
jgi:hypothetical protein